MTKRSVVAIVFAVVLLVWWLARAPRVAPEPEPTSANTKPATPSTAAHAPAAPLPVVPVVSATSEAPRAPTLAELRLVRAQETLDTYLRSNRHPPDSRPMREHPDMEQPHWVPTVTLKIKRADGKPGVADILLSQDRRFLVADETATLSMRCRVGQAPKPCKIYGAWLKKLVDPAVSGTPGGAPVSFAEGADGAMTARVQPATLGFAGYHGLLRVDVAVDVESESGATGYQLELTPDAPAAFTGTFDEAMVDGTLNLAAGIAVKRAGRYVLYARVDDSKGRTFAFLSINQELAEGEQKVPFRVFGKVVREEQPEAPFKLRDLEGFRLLEDRTPDRELVSAREGVVHTTKSYPLESFSDAEWQSPEKKRYVDELEKDVAKARADVAAEKK